MILNFKPDDELIEQCRMALRDNIREYDKLILDREEKRRLAKSKTAQG